MLKERKIIVTVLAIIIVFAIGGMFYLTLKKPLTRVYESQKQAQQEQQIPQQQELIAEEATTTEEVATPTTTPEVSKPATKPTTKLKPSLTSTWKTYRSPKYKVELKYPSNWTLKESYLNIMADLLASALNGWTKDSSGKTKFYIIDQVVTSEILIRNFENFGRNPTVTKTTVNGQEARLILSQKGEGALYGALIAKYPLPIIINNNFYYYFMIKFYRSDYLDEIKNTIKFIPII